MTKEDIETQAALYEDSCHTSSTQKHFCDGAEWAKQELVNKAAEWIYNNQPTIGDSMRKYIEKFRQAMEE